MTDAAQAIDEIIASDRDPDDVLRAVVAALVASCGCVWAGILFSDDGEFVLGPAAGEPDPARRAQRAVVFQGSEIAQLVTDGCNDEAFLERVATLISQHCLVGWDTGGVPWEAVS